MAWYRCSNGTGHRHEAAARDCAVRGLAQRSDAERRAPYHPLWPPLPRQRLVRAQPARGTQPPLTS
eukprot:2346607-Prymnesium_polylepis.2